MYTYNHITMHDVQPVVSLDTQAAGVLSTIAPLHWDYCIFNVVTP